MKAMQPESNVNDESRLPDISDTAAFMAAFTQDHDESPSPCPEDSLGDDE